MFAQRDYRIARRMLLCAENWLNHVTTEVLARSAESNRRESFRPMCPALHGAPVLLLRRPDAFVANFTPKTFRSVVSHISRKTSEMPRISCTQRWTRPRVRLSLKERRMEFAKPRNFTGNRGCGHPSFRSKRQSFDNDSRWRDVPSVRKSSYTMAVEGDYRFVIHYCWPCWRLLRVRL